MTRGPDAGTMLARALIAMAAQAGCVVELITAESTAWASATFNGAQHILVVSGEGAALADWLGELPDTKFTLHGHLVASIAVDSICRDRDRYEARIAALTLIET